MHGVDFSTNNMWRKSSLTLSINITQNSFAEYFVIGFFKRPVGVDNTAKPTKNLLCNSCIYLLQKFMYEQTNLQHTFKYIIFKKQALIIAYYHRRCFRWQLPMTLSLSSTELSGWYFCLEVMAWEIKWSHLGPLLLTWFNFNPSMDK